MQILTYCLCLNSYNLVSSLKTHLGRFLFDVTITTLTHREKYVMRLTDVHMSQPPRQLCTWSTGVGLALVYSRGRGS